MTTEDEDEDEDDIWRRKKVVNDLDSKSLATRWAGGESRTNGLVCCASVNGLLAARIPTTISYSLQARSGE